MGKKHKDKVGVIDSRPLCKKLRKLSGMVEQHHKALVKMLKAVDDMRDMLASLPAWDVTAQAKGDFIGAPQALKKLRKKKGKG